MLLKDTIDVILENGRNCSKTERMPTMKGSFYQRRSHCWIDLLSCVLILITGIVTNAQSPLTSNPLSKIEQAPVTQILKELNNLGTEDEKIEVLFQLVQYADLNVIKVVLEDVDLDTPIPKLWDFELNSLLHVAVTRNAALVEHLLENEGFDDILHFKEYTVGLIEECLNGIQKISHDEFEERLKIMKLLFSLNPKLIESEVTPNERTPLHFAVEEKFENGKQLELIQFLIDYNANVNAIDERGSTPLLLAILLNYSSPDLISIIHLLIENNADPNILDQCGHSFLSSVTSEVSPMNFHEIFSQVVKLPNADLSKIMKMQGNLGSTVLHEAVYHFELLNETLQLVYDLDLDFNAVDNNGNTIFHYAIWGGRDESFLKTLIRFGADWKTDNELKETSLHWAAGYGNLRALKLLIHLGADVNAVNTVGDTALSTLFIASEKPPSNTFELVQELLKQGANVNLVNNCRNTPLEMAQYKVYIGETDQSVVDLMLKAFKRTIFEL